MLVMTGQSCISDYRASLTFKSSTTLLDIIVIYVLATRYILLPFGDIFKRQVCLDLQNAA